MSHIDPALLSDRLHRLVKLAMDTGEAASVAEAERLFAGYRLAVAVGADAARSPTLQAALLTMVNAGRRSFLGGVELHGVSGVPLLVRLPGYRTLDEAVAGLGGRITDTLSVAAPLVVLGDAVADVDRPFAVRATFDGWSGGVAPVGSGIRLGEQREFVPAGVLAGALAVGEAFQHLRRTNPVTGRREAGLSLWRPELGWRDPAAVGPAIDRLPSALWLIGLGNLGQAYLWTLGLLPYATPGDVRLVMQDFDVLAESNDSTSLLTHPGLIGMRKTRAMAAWAEACGFKTDVIERRFAANFKVTSDEPPVALCGVDNALARAALEDVGFARVIEAGLGKGTGDFLAFRAHTFPGARAARDLWSDGGDTDRASIDLPAYRALAAAGVDRCGLTQLAGRTVGAPFVGAAAAAVAIGELLRLVNGAHGHDLIDGHLRTLDHRTVISACELAPFNPGSTPAHVIGV